MKCIDKDSRGVFVGIDESGEFYNSIIVFMVVSLKKSIPFVIKSCPKTKTWLSSQITESIGVVLILLRGLSYLITTLPMPMRCPY